MAQLLSALVNVWYLVFALSTLHIAESLQSEGSAIVPSNSATFLGKFCFTFTDLPTAKARAAAGYLNVTVWAPKLQLSQKVNLVLFDDESESYPGPSSAWNNLSCEEKMNHTKKTVPLTNEAATQRGQFIRIGIREKVRPRWWYIAIADCSNTELAIRYKFHAVNEHYGWAREFSTDKRYALHVLLSLTVIYAGLAAIQRHANFALRENVHVDSATSKAAHPFARMLLGGIVSGFFAAVSSLYYAGIYTYDGQGSLVAYVFAKLFALASNFILVSLLLLVSEGKCISYVMVRGDVHRMLRMLGPFFCACVLLEFWGDFSNSRNYTTDYVYATPYGLLVVMVDIVLLSVYLSNLRATLTMERNGGNAVFYRKYGVLYSLWFLALPVTSILAQVILAQYAWYMVSLVVTSFANVLAYCALVAGLWPHNACSYFKLGRRTHEDTLEWCPSPPSRRDDIAEPLPRLLGRVSPPVSFGLDKTPKGNSVVSY